MNLFCVNNQKEYLCRATEQFKTMSNAQKKSHCSLFHAMCAFTGDLTSDLSFSVFVVQSMTKNRAAYGTNGLQRHFCLVTLEVYLTS